MVINKTCDTITCFIIVKPWVQFKPFWITKSILLSKHPFRKHIWVVWMERFIWNSNSYRIFGGGSNDRSNDEVEFLEENRYFLWNIKIWEKLAVVFPKITKFRKNWFYVMITQNISSNLRRVVRSAVTNEFNTACNMALYYFRLRFSGGFANERFWREEILGY